MRILVIEDDKSMQKLLSKRLGEEIYTVDSCCDGLEGLEYAQAVEYDCILLDLMIPKMSGLDVLRKLRESGNKAYILIITARGSVDDRIKGLDAGADDYLIKPFSLDELLARMRALIRRQNENKSKFITLEDLKIDTTAHIVTRANKTIDLTVKEYGLLEYFMRNQGVILTRTQINEHVWDYSYYTESNIVDVYIRYLRNKIDKGFDKKLIHTIRGFGYVMRAENDKDEH
jgi:DNA-binding response OmpR family regulator